MLHLFFFDLLVISSPLIVFAFQTAPIVCFRFHSFASLNAYKTRVPQLSAHIGCFLFLFCLLFRHCFASSFILSLHAFKCFCVFCYFSKGCLVLCVRVLFLLKNHFPVCSVCVFSVLFIFFFVSFLKKIIMDCFCCCWLHFAARKKVL